MGEVIINLNPNNLREAEIFIDGSPDDIETLLQNLYEDGGERIVGQAQANAPVKTGYMRDLIFFESIINGIVIIGGAPYTSFQEFGTELILPKYFITNAIAEIMPQIDEEADDIVSAYLEKVEREMNDIDYDVITVADFIGV